MGNGPVGAEEVSQTLFRRGETFARKGRKNPLLVHNDPIPFVEQIIIPEVFRREINGHQICPGAQAPAITVALSCQIKRADRGDDPLGPHQPERCHGI